MNLKNVIQTEGFIREPVDELRKKINESSSSKIILNGGRGSGKSVILSSMEDRGLGTEHQTILMRFDSCVPFSSNFMNDYDSFVKHYYELILARDLLFYVKKYYPYTYEMYFKDTDAFLQDMSKTTIHYINNQLYDDKKLEKMVSSMEVSSKIVKRMKEKLKIDTITLAIDRFDWTHGRSEAIQKLLSTYFPMFDKVVITTDDESLEETSKRSTLEKKGYSFISSEYGKDRDVLNLLTRKRIELSNVKKYREYMEENLLNTDIYEDLIAKGNGNISFILSTIFEILRLVDWYDGKVENLKEEFEREIDSQVKHVREMKEIDSHPPRLYLS